MFIPRAKQILVLRFDYSSFGFSVQRQRQKVYSLRPIVAININIWDLPTVLEKLNFTETWADGLVQTGEKEHIGKRILANRKTKLIAWLTYFN